MKIIYHSIQKRPKYNKFFHSNILNLLLNSPIIFLSAEKHFSCHWAKIQKLLNSLWYLVINSSISSVEPFTCGNFPTQLTLLCMYQYFFKERVFLVSCSGKARQVLSSGVWWWNFLDVCPSKRVLAWPLLGHHYTTQGRRNAFT